MTNDVQRMIELRSEVRASYYRCRHEMRLASDARLRRLLERSAFVRWRLARSIDGFIAAQPTGASRLRPTLRDLAASLALQARGALLAADRSLPVLRWLADDTAQLRHAVELCRATTLSLVISDLLGERLEELKPVQAAVGGMIAIATPLDTILAAHARAGGGSMGRYAAH